MKSVKVFSAALAIVMVLLFIMLIFRLIDPLLFWLLAAAIAVCAYIVIPKISKSRR